MNPEHAMRWLMTDRSVQRRCVRLPYVACKPKCKMKAKNLPAAKEDDSECNLSTIGNNDVQMSVELFAFSLLQQVDVRFFAHSPICMHKRKMQ